MNLNIMYHSRPDAGDGYFFLTFSSPVYGQSFCKYRHCDLSYCICCLSSEEARVDGWADYYDLALLAVMLEIWKCSLDGSV